MKKLASASLLSVGLFSGYFVGDAVKEKADLNLKTFKSINAVYKIYELYQINGVDSYRILEK